MDSVHRLPKYIVITCFTFFIAFNLPVNAQDLSSVPFETIDQGTSSYITSATNLILYNKREWTAFWKEHSGNTEPPSVNFRNDMVVAIMLGARPEGCYRIDIDGISKDSSGRFAGQFVVFYKETVPGNNCICIPVITTPYHIIKTEKSRTVRFRGDVIIHDCN
ncbi:MAG: protease complex subunit PrcB family protein [Candidatus Brocadia sp.]|nr:protease complex subunit PrcB family protein [Candidatus Brocadia sp.]NUO07740.1 protease complex subunit PrcB family protein [Candidatus Brocadia sp.]